MGGGGEEWGWCVGFGEERKAECVIPDVALYDEVSYKEDGNNEDMRE